MTPRPPHARLIAAALVLGILATGCGRAFQPPAAVVQGSRITDSEVRQSIPLFRFLAALRQQQCGAGQTPAGASPQAACSRFVLSQLITEHVVSAYALAHGVAVTRTDVLNAVAPLEQQLGGRSGLQQQLSRQHLTYTDLYGLARRLLLIQKVAQAVAGQEIPDQELRARYEQERLRFTLLHVAHILVHGRRTAAGIAAKATPGNFARLARRYSTDPSASRGGDLGTTPALQIASSDPEFLRAALALRPGQISGPVRTRLGWEVIHLIAVRLVPFRLARAELLSELSGTAFTSWLRRQFRSGTIDVNPRYGRFDPRAELVVPVTCTAATPAPSCAAT